MRHDLSNMHMFESEDFFILKHMIEFAMVLTIHEILGVPEVG